MRLLWFATAIWLCLSGCTDESAAMDSSCRDPAPVMGQFAPEAPGYIVMFHDGIDTASEAARLASVYAITLRSVYTIIPAFFATFDDDVLERLRCESSVQYIEHNEPVVPAVNRDTAG
jgi:hypothetical protein